MTGSLATLQFYKPLGFLSVRGFWGDTFNRTFTSVTQFLLENKIQLDSLGDVSFYLFQHNT